MDSYYKLPKEDGDKIFSEIEKLKEENKKLKEIIQAYKGYVSVLSAEIDDHLGFLYAHGVQSKRVREGEMARKELEGLGERL